jgi:hypothetical protein
MVNGALRHACRFFARPRQVVRMLRCAVSVGQTVGQRGEKGLSSAGKVHVACIMMQPATCNMQHEACNMQHNTQRATQHAVCSMICTPLHGVLHVAQSVACCTVCCMFLHVACFVACCIHGRCCCMLHTQRATSRSAGEGTLPATCNTQHATCNTQRATCTQHSAGRDGRAHCGCALASPAQ